mgnify:CR=1 FL=1
MAKPNLAILHKSTKCFSVVVLLWLENMSYDEIGAVVGITAKNVSVRLFRIKEELKKMD